MDFRSALPSSAGSRLVKHLGQLLHHLAAPDIYRLRLTTSGSRGSPQSLRKPRTVEPIVLLELRGKPQNRLSDRVDPSRQFFEI
ncbi:hypothetical protein [Burkholderia ubonensis]|uniref:hypothetical protein n=1 Tax=Burkholderia ubonensis TaxID=101571 RepID=UPI0012FB2A51|nr:hypothetical protein [Burkholderia ubonensis]